MELIKNKYTHYIIILSFSILVFGLFMVYDASRVWAMYKYADSFYYIKRQLVFAFLGLIVFILAYKLDLKYLYKYTEIILLISLVLLVLVLIPGIGQKRNGSRSWFGIGALGFQPSELFKISIILYASKFLSKNYDRTTKFKTILPLLALVILGFILIMFEPDFGTGLVTLVGVCLVLFVSKLKTRYYVILGVISIIFFIILIVSAPYRFDRISSFIDPYQDPLGTGFQMIQSLYAIGPSGLTGFGYLNSLQQHYYLPEPQTDFIFAIIVSDFGLVGAFIFLFAFGFLFYSSYKLSSYENDTYIMFLKVGLTSVIMIQTLINLCVVSGLLPVTGITLPLVSYGGSSLVITMLTLGIVANKEKDKHAIFNLG